MKLSNQQEHFCQEYVKDSNATRSYKTAYNVNPETKDSSVWVNASKLLSNTKVTLRLSELKKALADKQLWTREMSVKTLAKIAIKKENKPAEIVSAVKELNAMHGYNAPTKLDHQSSDGSMTPKETNSDLITEALKAKYAHK
mgnify:CR=1 FL=1